MRSDWNQRAREDPHYYVAFGGRDQDEAAFLDTATDVVRLIEAELKRLPRNSNRRALRALEIGCGPGRLMRMLSRHFGEIHGVDVSDEMIGLARQRLRDIPYAHVHANNGASLPQFADESFDFIYSYAVFQHIPSRDVILEYMRETRRVLKPGAFFHGQFNGLAHSATPDTWSGAVFSPADIRFFTSNNGFQLLNLDGVDTQYMWTTWLKNNGASTTPSSQPPMIRRTTNAYSGEPLIPHRGRHAAVSVWIQNLPAECDLNGLDVVIDGSRGVPIYIGPPGVEGIQQVNAWLPKDARTGLVPVELQFNHQRLCPPAIARIVPAGPLVPRIVSITDGVNLVQKNQTTTGLLKIQVEEISSSGSIAALLDNRPLDHIDILCTDPMPPRHEINLKLPEDLPAGPHTLEIRVGSRRLPPTQIDVISHSL
jgi:SAM-dependent methyltransferase